MPPAVEERDGGTLIRVRVQPKASREAITGNAEAIKVALTAPPVEGEANAALLALLAKRLKVAKSALVLVSGEKSREKAVLVPGRTPADVVAALGLGS